MVDRFDMPPAEALVVMASQVDGDGPAWKAGALAVMLANGQA
jgi:hypothetical protein